MKLLATAAAFLLAAVIVYPQVPPPLPSVTWTPGEYYFQIDSTPAVALSTNPFGLTDADYTPLFQQAALNGEKITALVALIALLISMAGTYAVLSFTVARHTREIGIRIALGADPRRIVARVFSRAMVQIGIGVVVGTLIWFYVIVQVPGAASAPACPWPMRSS
jgi:ABC-type antimicrobial peptide transport system permease subunit